ncbi:Stk1 family PASTA domain-containing Ser/Thr kinase [Yanshouia hominis]|uniref:non-specific serine/threonine protein kinase n=1 Tax=Yanshouia hominis TaxID=2763673 RepID=A0ABR7NGB9_9FIRM|nr:Stk1 family PASTA domain-containing Ser/Thr kinase [Yanshouia hominis]MBC8575431.1 Stk1 family PASTA domain-containing Ser/Thr kinase [Yanshouia hominis]
MDNYIGKKIEGRYLVNELIGVGGMANVYKATDVTDGKTVAVKVLREEFCDNEEFLRRFKNESKAIAMLSHPNIIKVYDVCFSHKIQVIVMEYVDGITLKEYLEEQSPLSWKETLHFTTQVLRALSHAHSKGIVHRDIKPQNVMLLPNAQIKITDFGIARFARSEARTLTDRAIGSVHYISPEQAQGEHTDQRADLYSVGVMLYEMLTGQLPFDADSPVSVALKQIEMEPPMPRSINPEIPEGLEEITMRALQKDPEQRYQSADEMLADIEEFKADPSVRFEYDYLTDPAAEKARCRRAILSLKKGKAPMKPDEAKRDTPRRAPRRRDGEERPRARHTAPAEEEDQRPVRRYGEEERRPRRDRGGEPRRLPKEDYQEERSGSVLMALAGITAAFVVISIVFIGAMLYLNNPLEKVPDVQVPDFKGLKYDAVTKAEEYSSFTFEVEDNQYNDLYERGAIISQKPKEGTKVKPNSVVRVVVSNGTKVVKMPNLIGLEETEAYYQLAELDLEYQKVEIFSDQTPGTVVGTEPGYDSEIPASTVVKVQISMGPENKIVEVPDLKGKSIDAARAALEELGLEVGGISYVPSDEKRDVVLSQDPAPTSQMSTGGFVNLNVSAGEGQSNLITLHIPLPKDVEEIVKMQAMFDGKILSEERVQPSTARFWKPTFQGTGTAKIFILYNDFLYQTYEVSFGTGAYTLVEDNSANVTGQSSSAQGTTP